MKREADRVRERKEGTNKHSNFSFNASRTGRRVFEHDRPSRLPAAACYAPPATRAKLSSPSKRAFSVRDEKGASASSVSFYPALSFLAKVPSFIYSDSFQRRIFLPPIR